VRALHRSTAQQRAAAGSDGASKDGGNNAKSPNSTDSPVGDVSAISSLFKHLSTAPAKPQQPAAAGATNPDRAVQMEEFFKMIKAETEAKSASLNPNATKSEGIDKSAQVADILKMMQPMAQMAASSQPSRRGKDSSSALFDTLFKTSPDSTQAGSTLRPGQQDLKAVFGSFAPATKRTEEFKYWTLFPRQIQKWLIYTRTTPVRIFPQKYSTKYYTHNSILLLA
jgi:hypothetical protein